MMWVARLAHCLPLWANIMSRGQRQCVDCGVFIGPTSMRCRSCARKELHARGVYGPPGRRLKCCLDCGKHISPNSLRCRSCAMRAKWRDPDYHHTTTSRRREVRMRDNFTCVLCDIHEDGHAHDVHHIDFDKTNNCLSNLITLCHSCHSIVTHKRIILQNLDEML